MKHICYYFKLLNFNVIAVYFFGGICYTTVDYYTLIHSLSVLLDLFLSFYMILFIYLFLETMPLFNFFNVIHILFFYLVLLYFTLQYCIGFAIH